VSGGSIGPSDGEWITWTGGTPLIDWSGLYTKLLVSTPTPSVYSNPYDASQYRDKGCEKLCLLYQRYGKQVWIEGQPLCLLSQSDEAILLVWS
jgi:hypothetical protein